MNAEAPARQRSVFGGPALIRVPPPPPPPSSLGFRLEFVDESSVLWRLQICFVRFLRCFYSLLPPAFEITVSPFEIHMRTDMDFYNFALPNLRRSSRQWSRFNIDVVKFDMIFEQLDIILADRGREQLAKVAQGVVQVSWPPNLVGVNDPVDPDFLQFEVVFQ